MPSRKRTMRHHFFATLFFLLSTGDTAAQPSSSFATNLGEAVQALLLNGGGKVRSEILGGNREIIFDPPTDIDSDHAFQHLVSWSVYDGYLTFMGDHDLDIHGTLLCLDPETCHFLPPPLKNESIKLKKSYWDKVILIPRKHAEDIFSVYGSPPFYSKIYLGEASLEKNKTAHELGIYEAYGIEIEGEYEENLVETWVGLENAYRADFIWKRRSDLKGKEMTTVLIEEPSTFSAINSRGDGGSNIPVELLSELGRRMNFTLRYVPKAVVTTVEEIMQILSKGDSDMSTSFYYITMERMDMADFTKALASTKLVMVTRNDMIRSSRTSIFRTLHSSVWLAVVFTLALLVAFGLLILTKLSNGRDGFSYLEAAVTIYGACLAQGAGREVRSISLRVLLWTTLAFGILFINALAARLISTLSVVEADALVEALEDVRDLDLKLFIVRGGHTEDKFKNAREGVLKDLWENNVDHSAEYFLEKEMIEVFLEEENEESAMLLNPFYVELLLEENEVSCSLILTELHNWPAMFIGVPFRKGFPFMKSVNYHLQRMYESGMLQYMYKQYLNYRKTKESVCSSVSASATATISEGGIWEVDLGGTKTFFVLLTLGGLLSILLALAEKKLSKQMNQTSYVQQQRT